MCKSRPVPRDPVGVHVPILVLLVVGGALFPPPLPPSLQADNRVATPITMPMAMAKRLVGPAVRYNEPIVIPVPNIRWSPDFLLPLAFMKIRARLSV